MFIICGLLNIITKISFFFFFEAMLKYHDNAPSVKVCRLDASTTSLSSTVSFTSSNTVKFR